MAYKALVVDVDGTLICSEQPWLSDLCLATLQGLQKRGIPVIICTGRGGCVTGADTLSGFTADYIVCSNGACVLDKSGKMVYAQRFSHAHVELLIEYADKNEYPLSFSFEDSYYAYTGYEVYKDYYRETFGDPEYMLDGTMRTRHLKDLPFGAYMLVSGKDVKKLSDKMPGLRFLELEPNAFNICLADMDKTVGLDRLLKLLGLGWHELVAIGDNINDSKMIKSAGKGIAMGNAPPEVKSVADIVTGTVLEDGIVEPVNRIFYTCFPHKEPAL